MDSSDPYLVFRNMKGDVVHKTEVVVKNLNPKFASFEISIDKLCGSNPHFAEVLQRGGGGGGVEKGRRGSAAGRG